MVNPVDAFLVGILEVVVAVVEVLVVVEVLPSPEGAPTALEARDRVVGAFSSMMLPARDWGRRVCVGWKGKGNGGGFEEEGMGWRGLLRSMLLPEYTGWV